MFITAVCFIFLINLQWIPKIAYVKIFKLQQCWQKGFNVNSWWANDENNLTTEFF